MLRIHSTLLLAALTLSAAAATAQTPATRCVDEAAIERNGGRADGEPMQPEDPRLQLQTLVRDAVTRSQAVGAARLLAEAAVDDVAEVNAQRKPTVSLNGGVNAGSTTVNGITDNTGAQARAGFNVTAPLYDSGRIGKLGAERPIVARGLIEVDVADYHADAVAVEGFVDRQLLLIGAVAADAKDLDGVADFGEAVFAGHSGGPRLDIAAMDLDGRAARSADQVVMVVFGAAPVHRLAGVGAQRVDEPVGSH